ncbi:hypothetical protein ATY77_26000 [Rhizobium sp. R634]|nr:hypothetical protein ATY77_26000 [Rhizobium sp. R634]
MTRASRCFWKPRISASEWKAARNYRQLFVPFGKSAYVLRYRIHEEADTLVVVRVWHGREQRV